MVSLWNSLPCVQDDERQSQFSGEQLLVKDKQEMLCSSAQLDELAAGHKSVARRLKKKFLPQVVWIECYVLHKCLKRQEKPMPVHWELSPSLFHERHKEFLRISIGWVLTQFYVVEPLVSVTVAFVAAKGWGTAQWEQGWGWVFCCCLCLKHLAGGHCGRWDVRRDLIWHRFYWYKFPWLLPFRGYTSKNIKQNKDQRQLYLHILSSKERISSLSFACEVNHTGMSSFLSTYEF